MSYYGSWGYPQHIPVAQQKIDNANKLAKLAKKNSNLKPVILEGTKIAKTFWGKAWCDNIETYSDYENRLPRGRSYVRYGAVLDLQITKGVITALVAGTRSKPYEITVEIAPLPPERWDKLKSVCSSKIASLLDLAQGKLPAEVLAAFCEKENGLFPSQKEMKTRCSCPDWADLCKHLAGVLYGVGARLDDDPYLFFTLRGIDVNELIGGHVIDLLTAGVDSSLATDDLSSVFGVDFDTLEDSMPIPKKGKKAVAPTKKAKQKSKAKSDPKKKVKSKVTPAPIPEEELTADRIRTIRQLRGWTQAVFGKKIGVSATTVCNYEKGYATPRPEVAAKIRAMTPPPPRKRQTRKKVTRRKG